MDNPVKANSTVPNVPAVEGEHSQSGTALDGKSVSGMGVHGMNDAPQGGSIKPNFGCGVWGESTNGYGVFGSSDNSVGVSGHSVNNEGVRGESPNVKGIGVHGTNQQGGSKPDTGCGVWGESTSGYGVFGSSNFTYGVFGTGNTGVSGSGYTIGVSGDSKDGTGVQGTSNSPSNAGVLGLNLGGGPAVAGDGNVVGVFGESAKGMGIHGVNDSPQGSSIKPNVGCGVWGESTNGFGVFGSADNNVGVQGESGNADAVQGTSHSQIHAGVSGINDSSGIGVYGQNTTGKGLAGKFIGDVEVTGDIRLIQQDLAEDFDVLISEEAVPGTVMVLNEVGKLIPCHQSYDTMVLGVVAGAGQFKPAIILGRQDTDASRHPLALVGKVYCKVDANFAPIAPGDMLTTSPTTGHAMKVVDRDKAFGAVIGKALEALPEGVGLIPMVIALQ